MNVASPLATPSMPQAGQPGGMREAHARKVAQDFESFFISSMLESMSSGIEVDPMFGGGPGEEVYRSLLNQEYARTFAKAGGVGVADSVYREMMRAQEGR